ncbi:MAG: Rossmann-like and DUF2520 domain-containing protein [Thermodesulfobacteriota bacterium]|nr:Rossmann-like and DUF2520 domain-containing protein [Thermodesulfobacteriota bacterium]
MSLSFVIVGPGKLGTALGIQLSATSGYTPLGIAGRTLPSAQAAADQIGAGSATAVPWEVTRNADIVFITTPDGTIADVSENISRHEGFKDGAVVLHCSGSLPSTILNVNNATIAKGSMHPLQSFAGGDSGTNPFAGINMAIEGDPQARDIARQIGSMLGANVFSIKTPAKALYHAAAVVASNYLVTLMDTAFSLLETAGIDRARAGDILRPLVQGTMTNIDTVGIPDALTGPIARGDTTTVADHLREIAVQRKELLNIYSILGCRTIPIAAAKNTINDEQAEALTRMLQKAMAHEKQ